MSLNWTEIDLVLEELTLPGCFIQEIIQPDFRNLYLGLFRESERFYLRICLETGKTRLHRSTKRPRKPRTRQRFAQLLHSKIRGGKIQTAKQLNRDRIIRIDLSRSSEEYSIWVRLWGGASNILLTEADGTIIDAFFRRPGRNEVSEATYAVNEQDLSPEQIEKTNHFVPRVTESVNAYFANHYCEQEELELRQKLLSQCERRLEREIAGITRRREELEAKIDGIGEPEQLRHYGDLLYSYLHLVTSGTHWAELPDYERGNEPVAISLSPELSPQQNAQRFYDRAKKSERRKRALHEEIQNLNRRENAERLQLSELPQASLHDLHQIAESHSNDSTIKDKDSDRPGLGFMSGGFTILVGRNSRENDVLLRRYVRGNDTWLHTRDYPGGYVFVKSQRGKSVPLPVLIDAGMLAVHYSKAKPNRRADLYYTQVKYLRRSRNGPIGLVLPTQEKNLHVEIDDTRIAELLGTDQLT